MPAFREMRLRFEALGWGLSSCWACRTGHEAPVEVVAIFTANSA